MSRNPDNYTSNPKRGTYGIIFAISTICFLAIWASPFAPWSWVTLPFVCTYFVRWMDWM